ncbi:hypothetical protein [Psychrobacter sp. DM4]|uniref:hypothetical protein n=1 Tax=Psychrobacter sp. DM4 TaxID=3440637 RepID=UPI003F4FC81B
MTLLVIKTLVAKRVKNILAINFSLITRPAYKSLTAKPNVLNAATKDDSMTDQVDNWHKLARFDTNMQGELNANLLRNNGITVSLQALSAIPGMNSGVVLWVQDTDLAQSQRILSGVSTATDGEALLEQMSDAELGIVPDTRIDSVAKDK